MVQYGNDPGLLLALQEGYGETILILPPVPSLRGQDLASDRLTYIKQTGWGSAGNDKGQYAAVQRP